MIEFAFNDTIQLERFVKDNYDGTQYFEEPVTLRCYKEKKTNKVVTSTGEEVYSGSNYFTREKINERDRIDGHDVLSVEEFKALSCKYYRSYT